MQLRRAVQEPWTQSERARLRWLMIGCFAIAAVAAAALLFPQLLGL